MSIRLENFHGSDISAAQQMVHKLSLFSRINLQQLTHPLENIKEDRGLKIEMIVFLDP